MKTLPSLFVLAALLLPSRSGHAADVAPSTTGPGGTLRPSDRVASELWQVTASGARLALGAGQLELHVAARQLAISFCIPL